jgi:hypothetical protein
MYAICEAIANLPPFPINKDMQPLSSPMISSEVVDDISGVAE